MHSSYNHKPLGKNRAARLVFVSFSLGYPLGACVNRCYIRDYGARLRYTLRGIRAVSYPNPPKPL